MRKLNIVLPLIFLFIGLYILFSGYITPKESIELKVKSIKTYNEYKYSDKEEYEITYFTTMLLNNKEYYLKCDNNKILLSNPRETISKVIYNNELYYIVTVLFTLESASDFNNAYLEIINNDYNVSVYIGAIKVINNNDNFIDYNHIEGHYAYINNNLILVGLSIEFNKKHILNDLRISNNAFIQINNIYKLDKDLDNIIKDYSFNIYDKSTGSYTIEPNVRYYLPIGYNKLEILGRINILFNNDLYLYVPALKISKLDLNDYPGFIRSGEVVRNN